MIYGYSFAEEAIVGIQVLESKETPGLGDKIETDPAFLANFERLDVSLADDLSEMANPIEPVKHGEKTTPWQVDGITGATISSEAIANILDRSARTGCPGSEAHLATFRERTRQMARSSPRAAPTSSSRACGRRTPCSSRCWACARCWR